MPKKPRVHNEWFATVSYGGRKSCINCHAKFASGEQQWTWGEYVRARWHTVARFCRNCFEKEVRIPLLAHLGPCGCTVNLIARHGALPNWLTLEDNK